MLRKGDRLQAEGSTRFEKSFATVHHAARRLGEISQAKNLTSEAFLAKRRRLEMYYAGRMTTPG